MYSFFCCVNSFRKFKKIQTKPNLTLAFPVYTVDSSVLQTEASLLNLSGHYYSGLRVSDYRTGSWELKTELHNFSLTGYRHSILKIKNKKTLKGIDSAVRLYQFWQCVTLFWECLELILSFLNVKNMFLILWYRDNNNKWVKFAFISFNWLIM